MHDYYYSQCKAILLNQLFWYVLQPSCSLLRVFVGTPTRRRVGVPTRRRRERVKPKSPFERRMKIYHKFKDNA